MTPTLSPSLRVDVLGRVSTGAASTPPTLVDGDADGAGLLVGELVGAGVAEAEGDGVAVWLGVAVWVGVAVRVGVAVCVGVALGITVCVGLGITVCVGLGEAVGWGLWVGVIEGEADGEGEAWLQLRFIGLTPTLCRTSSIFGDR